MDNQHLEERKTHLQFHHHRHDDLQTKWRAFGSQSWAFLHLATSSHSLLVTNSAHTESTRPSQKHIFCKQRALKGCIPSASSSQTTFFTPLPTANMHACMPEGPINYWLNCTATNSLYLLCESYDLAPHIASDHDLLWSRVKVVYSTWGGFIIAEKWSTENIPRFEMLHKITKHPTSKSL